MKINTVNKVVLLMTLSGILTACSNAPKKVSEPPALGAAIEVPAPGPQFVETPRGPSLTVNDVLFDFEESNLRPEADSTVEKAANYLRDNPERVALVEGHTDHTGDEAYNQTLSVQRSQSIKDALMARGINENRIQTKGLGESQPVADNGTLEGRQANRRVEMVFVIDDYAQ